MSFFSDHTPWEQTKRLLHVFDKRQDQPFVQGTLRNLAHAIDGDDIANWTQSNLLGDYEGGYRHAQNVPKQNSMTDLLAPSAGTGASASSPSALSATPDISAGLSPTVNVSPTTGQSTMASIQPSTKLPSQDASLAQLFKLFAQS